jgi:integrase/recombinase XerD
VRVLASLAGHKSIAVTQRYIDVNDDMKRSAVELL